VVADGGDGMVNKSGKGGGKVVRGDVGCRKVLRDQHLPVC